MKQTKLELEKEHSDRLKLENYELRKRIEQLEQPVPPPKVEEPIKETIWQQIKKMFK